MAVPDLAVRYDVDQTVDFILDGGYQRVALQFPDDLLPDSPAVYQLLQQRLGDTARVFILADTAYNPLGVDEVAAQHMGAQCVIHYGRASLAPVTSLPVFFVFPKDDLDVFETAAAVGRAVGEAVRARCGTAGAANGAAAAAAGSDRIKGGEGGVAPFAAVLVLVDQGYHHALAALSYELQGGPATAAGRGAGGGGDGGGGDGKAEAQGDEEAAPPELPPWIFASIATRSLRPQLPQPQQPAPKPAGAGCCSGGASAATLQGGSGCGEATCSAEGAGTRGAGGAEAGRGCRAAATASGSVPPECCEVAGGGGGCADRHLAGAAGAGTATPSTASAAATVLAEPGTAPRPPSPAAAAGPRASQQEDGRASGTGDGGQTAEAAACTGIDDSSSNGCGCSSRSAGGRCSSGSSTRMAGLCWALPPGAGRRGCLYVWVGPYGSAAHQVLQLTHSMCEWLSYDPMEGGPVRQGLSDESRRLLKRRNFMVEKTRSASIVGLLVGTLGSAGFRDVISSLRRLAAAAGKKTYTFLMGKPNPAKLGNFPEVDVFVMVCDAEGLILDCRDYLAPLVTPWEAATALTGGHLDPEEYSMEMRDVVELEARQRQRHEAAGAEAGAGDMALQALGHLGLSVATRGSAGTSHEVIARNAAEFLALKRTFKGLEMPATGASPKAAELAVEGLSGRAALYSDEGPAGRAGAPDL